MNSLEILQWIVLGVAYAVFLIVSDNRKGWRYWPYLILFALAISTFGGLNYVEGRHDVIECLQTNETEC